MRLRLPEPRNGWSRAPEGSKFTDLIVVHRSPSRGSPRTGEDAMTQHPAQGRTALLVIDMQNSYFDFPELEEQRESVTEKVNELIRAAREGGCPIVLIRTQHERDGSTWTVNMHD